MKRKIFAALTMSMVLMLSTAAQAGNQLFINDEFDNSDSLEHWEDNTNRGNKELAFDGENAYMKMTATSSFFNYQAKDVYATGRLYCSFDVKFTDNNMEVQLRESKDISASGFTVAGRLRKNVGYIEYFSDGKYIKLNDTTGNWLKISDVSSWYRIKMVCDIPRNKYSIYLMNNAGKTIGQAENVPFFGKCNYINYFAFSSTDVLCIDNVRIEEIDTDNIKVKGTYYPKISSNGDAAYNYAVIAKDENNKDFTVEGVKWSLNRNVDGITINSTTGELTIEKNARPGIFLINAENIIYPDIKKSFLIDVER